PTHHATFDSKIQPMELVDTKIQLRTCVRRQSLPAISLCQQFPDRLRGRIFEERAIFARHLLDRHRAGGGSFFAAFFRFLVALASSMTLDFPAACARPSCISNRFI